MKNGRNQQPMIAPAVQGNSMMLISDTEFNDLRDLIQRRFGIHLTDQKRSLLVGRLQKLMRLLKLETFAAYYRYRRRSPKTETTKNDD